MRLIIVSLLFLGGCAWWQAGMSDPAIIDSAIEQADSYGKLASATGIPYADWVARSLAIFMVILIKGRTKSNA